MFRTGYCAALLLTFTILAVAQTPDAQTPDAPPNIVIVLADDLGYGDLRCYGHATIQSPNIDRFAADGIRLTSCYSAHPNCSPARAGLMTGRTPFRIGIYNWIPMFSPMHVRQEETTIATLLRNAGYDTCHVGKWHLNGDFNKPNQPQPSDHGFNHWFSTQNNALPNHRNPENFVRNGNEVGPLEGYSAQLVASEAAKWLTDGRDTEKPFFLFACFHEPHEPIASAPEFTQRYSSDDPSFAAHHGNVTQLDDGFGRILAALDSLDVRMNTLVFFTSDNGPAITPMHPHGSAGPLRDKKGAIYEGGIRVPGIIQWPGHIQPGTTNDTPISGVDLLPTLCEIAGIDLPKETVLDGTSIVPVFQQKPIQRSKPLYWQFNRAKSSVKVAVREGKWKLVAGLTQAGPDRGADLTEQEMAQIKSAELIGFELYNLQDDIGESTNLVNVEKAVFEALKKEMSSIFDEIRFDPVEWPSWEWPRYESSRIEWPEYWLNRKQLKQK